MELSAFIGHLREIANNQTDVLTRLFFLGWESPVEERERRYKLYHKFGSPNLYEIYSHLGFKSV